MKKENKKENKFIEFLKKAADSEHIFQAIPIFFLITCCLLVGMMFKLNQTNEYLKKIASEKTDGIEFGTLDERKSENEEENSKIQIDISENEPDTLAPYFEDTTSDRENTSKGKTESKPSKAPETSSSPQAVSKAPSPSPAPSSSAKQTEPAKSQPPSTENAAAKSTYVINKNSKTIHKSSCSFVDRMNDSNKLTVKLSLQELNEYIHDGYKMCKTCGGK